KSYLYNIKNIQVKMFSDRGYDVSTDNYKKHTTNKENELRMLYSHRYIHKKDNKKVIGVYYLGKNNKDKISKQNIGSYIDFLSEYTLYQSVLIIPVNLEKNAEQE